MFIAHLLSFVTSAFTKIYVHGCPHENAAFTNYIHFGKSLRKDAFTVFDFIVYVWTGGLNAFKNIQYAFLNVNVYVWTEAQSCWSEITRTQSPWRGVVCICVADFFFCFHFCAAASLYMVHFFFLIQGTIFIYVPFDFVFRLVGRRTVATKQTNNWG